MEKITINYKLMGNDYLVQNEIPREWRSIYDLLMTCETINTIMHVTLMARFYVNEYTLIWYKNGRKARLTISLRTH